MRGHTHMIVGVSTAIALTSLAPTQISFRGIDILPSLAVITAAAGSYAPDIDLKTSKAGKKHKIISSLLTHRGFTHTLVIPALLVGIMFFITNKFYVQDAICSVINSLIFGFLLGWVMHVFADLFNGKGVPLLYPLTSMKIHILRVVTGTWQENVWLFAYELCLVLFTIKRSLL